MASQQELRGLLGQMLFSGEDATKRTENLSGGEAARLIFCRLMLQKPNFLLLDEPTNQLDPNHQLEALQLLRERADAGAAVIVTLHDPNLAARFADRVLLLFGDGRWRLGPAAEVLTGESLSELYSTPMVELAAGGRRRNTKRSGTTESAQNTPTPVRPIFGSAPAIAAGRDFRAPRADRGSGCRL